ncbi:MAG: C69 family dipeptidase [Leptonema sp. (in: bacteria)]
MCDTFFIPANQNIYQANLLCKNSDREPNEAQAIQHLNRKKHKEKTLKTTYIVIPQVSETYEAYICKPFFMWGAEMGVNEWGVSIGNEAVFTKIPFNKNNSGLTGMDLIRLALERKETAKKSLEYIIELIEIYGQDACGGYENKNFYYHNSFLIVDKKEAFVLETAGKFWAYKKIKDFYSISNGLTLTNDYDEIHLEAIHFAKNKKWFPSNQEDFNFKNSFSDTFYTYFSKCNVRRSLTQKIANHDKIQLMDCIKTLQSHGENPQNKLDSMESICLHSGGILTPSETTGSMISVLRKNLITVWLTGTSHPCLSLYKPFYFGSKVLESLSVPSQKFDSSLWWTAEFIHRMLLENYPSLQEDYKNELTELQQELIQLDKQLSINKNISTKELDEISIYALKREKEILLKWKFELAKQKRKFSINFKRPIYSIYRKRLNQKAGFN